MFLRIESTSPGVLMNCCNALPTTSEAKPGSVSRSRPKSAQRLFVYLQQRAVAEKLVAVRALESATYGTDTTDVKPDWDALLGDLEVTTKQLNEIFLR